MLATRDFWFTHPIRYDRDWHDTLSAYRRCVSPWPHIPEPTEQDYIEHLLLTKDSAPGPDGLPSEHLLKTLLAWVSTSKTHLHRIKRPL